MSEALTTGE